MNNIVPIRRCICGELGVEREIVCALESVTVIACDKCMAKFDGELARVRPVFDAMLACGVTREVANITMTFLMERIADDGKSNDGTATD